MNLRLMKGGLCVARRLRQDTCGSCHHVLNRGIAKRTIFETRADMRMFLAQLARAVRRGEIRIFNFCLMTTHFHLFLESRNGNLASTMQRVQTAYSRYFNRKRRRDGPLVRGRFHSKIVKNSSYRLALARYIEWNPVHARIVESSENYEFSSAKYRVTSRVPRWLALETKISHLPRLARSQFEALEYVINKRLNSSVVDEPPEYFIMANSKQLMEWMMKKALLADGTTPGIPVCNPKTVLNAIDQSVDLLKAISARRGPDEEAMVQHVMCGLLRELCACTHKESARIIGKSPSAALASYQRFTHLRAANPDLAEASASIAQAALERSPLREFGLWR